MTQPFPPTIMQAASALQVSEINARLQSTENALSRMKKQLDRIEQQNLSLQILLEKLTDESRSAPGSMEGPL